MQAKQHDPTETMIYILDLANGDAMRDVRIRSIGSQEGFAAYMQCVNLGYIQQVGDQTTVTLGYERTYRITRKGWDYAIECDLIEPMD